MEIRFLDIARLELDQSINYYNHESPGLGYEFLAEILKSLRKIEEFPLAWQQLSKDIRRFKTNRFPYGIIYQIRPNEILIVAIANLHQKPEYWKDRI